MVAIVVLVIFLIVFSYGKDGVDVDENHEEKHDVEPSIEARQPFGSLAMNFSGSIFRFLC